jgi:hypothetical protein
MTDWKDGRVKGDRKREENHRKGNHSAGRRRAKAASCPSESGLSKSQNFHFQRPDDGRGFSLVFVEENKWQREEKM